MKKIAAKTRSRQLFRRHSGFTLVETLVAIAILMIAVVGPLTVAEKGLSASIYAREQLMASYLAQDGLESIRNIVDTNQSNIQAGALTDSSDEWITQGIKNLSTCTPSAPCSIDTTIPGYDISSCGSSCPLYLGPNGYTTQSGAGQNTPFTRTFYVVPFIASSASGANGGNGADNAANIVVTVTWQSNVTGGGGVTLEDTIFDAPLQ